MSKRPELDLPLANMNSLVALAADLLIENANCPPPGKHYLLPFEIGQQIAALLIAARDYGEAQIAEHDGAAK